MVIDIDIDKLKSRAAVLREELAKVDNMLALVEQYSQTARPTLPEVTYTTGDVYVAPKIMVPTHAPMPPFSGPTAPSHVRGFTAGLRRAVIMALHTGPSTESDLARALAWDRTRTRTVVSSMLKFRICYLSEHGRLVLTDEGKTQAAWYLANPSKLTYSPNPRWSKGNGNGGKA